MTPAPIVVFGYNRPLHLERCLQALAQAELAAESSLFIFCDGAKSEADAAAVEETRRVARAASGFSNLTVREAPANFGLATSVSQGVSEICKEFGRVIVVEDDIVVSPAFLSHMNQALERYKENEAVMQVSGFMFGLDFGPPARSFFMRMTTSWGWATWQRAWAKFSNDPSRIDLAAIDADTARRFDLDGHYPFMKMLRYRIEGKNSSWAALWAWTVFNAEGLVLHPTRSLVSNIGFDGSGTHFTKPPLPGDPAHPWTVSAFNGSLAFPEQIAADERASEMVKRFMFVTSQKPPKPKKPKPPKVRIRRTFFQRLNDSISKRLRKLGLK
jgi:hypothetical protein